MKNLETPVKTGRVGRYAFGQDLYLWSPFAGNDGSDFKNFEKKVTLRVSQQGFVGSQFIFNNSWTSNLLIRLSGVRLSGWV